MFERTTKSLEVIDLLKNSDLPKGHLIRDVFRYGCQAVEKRLDPSLALPRRTLECYYQYITDGKLQFDTHTSLNEIQPLLYLSLRYQKSY